MKSLNNDVFIHDLYWGVWYRCLVAKNDPKRYVARVCITPIGGYGKYSTDEMCKLDNIRILSDLDGEESTEYCSVELGDDVYDGIVKHHSEDVVYLLLHADLLPHIDWDKYRKVDNGGASLKDILKDGVTINDILNAK